jgi:hypothetical protein
MDGSDDDITATVQAYRDRRAAATGREAEQEKTRQEAEYRRQQNVTAWGDAGQSHTVAGIIAGAVVKEGNRIAQIAPESSLLFYYQHQTDPLTILFTVHESRSPAATLAALRFSMDDDGLVSATTDIHGLSLPPPCPRNDVTALWVAGITREVWKAAFARKI